MIIVRLITRRAFSSSVGSVDEIRKRAADKLLEGKQAVQSNDIEKAFALFDSAGKMFKEAGDVQGYIHSIEGTAFGYLTTGNIDSAISLTQSCLEILDEKKHESYSTQLEPLRGKLLQSLGSMYGHKGDFKSAIPPLERALPLLKSSPSSPSVSNRLWTLYAELARNHAKSNNTEEAVRILNESKSLVEKMGDRGKEFKLHYMLANHLRNQQKWDEALESLRKAVEIAIKSNDRQAEIHAMKAVADTHVKRGNVPEAMEALKSVLEIAKSASDSSSQTAILLNLGRMSFLGGKSEESEAYLKEALDIAESTGDHKSRVLLLAMRAEVHLDRQESIQANQVLDSAKKIFESDLHGDISPADKRLLLGTFAKVAIKNEQFDDALKYLLQCKEIDEANEDYRSQFVTAGYLAKVYRQLGNLTEANDALAKAVTLAALFNKDPSK